MPLTNQFKVSSPNVKYSNDKIESNYNYNFTKVETKGEEVIVVPQEKKFQFNVDRNVPKLGVMIVGLGGNNGTTVTAGIIANREGITWRTKKGIQTPNYYGSITQSSTMRLGEDQNGEDIFIPLSKILPMVNPNDFIIGGWDINGANMAEAMQRAEVLEWDLQRQLIPFMKDMKPLPSIYIPDFIAANQSDRANHVIKEKNKKQMVEHIRNDIRNFKEQNKCDSIVVIWSANTERFSDIKEGLNDTSENLLKSIEKDEFEISPSTLFAVASILEGIPYINGSPQNTFVPGVIELAEKKKVLVLEVMILNQVKLKSRVLWLIS